MYEEFPDEEAVFARSSATDAFGKLDNELPPVRIDDQTLIELQRLANESRMNLSEFIRTVVRVRVWGFEHLQTVANDRLRRAVGNVEQMPGMTSSIGSKST
jgi:hypothetical protein